jgi:hypothetical protein
MSEVRVDVDVCATCGLVGWSCLCDPSRTQCRLSEAQLQRARRSRLTNAEQVVSRAPRSLEDGRRTRLCRSELERLDGDELRFAALERRGGASGR